MAEVVLYHHVQGLTPGVHEFADRLRAGGHSVHVPDMFDGRTFDSIDDGFAYGHEVGGLGPLREQAVAAAEEFPREVVYAGMSLGVMTAQRLAQTRPGAKGALLLMSCVPPEEFGGGWPDGVPAQIHGKEGDEFFAEDIDAARALAASARDVELFVYPGDQHLFVDSSLDDFDAEATDLLTERVLGFLDTVD